VIVNRNADLKKTNRFE